MNAATTAAPQQGYSTFRLNSAVDLAVKSANAFLRSTGGDVDRGALPCPAGLGYTVAMAYETFRVEITRDDTRANEPAVIEITAYFDRMPETNEASVGFLSRVRHEVWSGRLQYAGDFASLGEALAAIDAAQPEAERIRCYEYGVDNEFPVEVAPLLRHAGKWTPGEGPA
jgi:hypothetical protein